MTVVEGTEYVYHVQAIGSESLLSNAASSTTPLNAPAGLTASTVSSSRIDLQWTDVSANESQFLVERSNADGTSFVEIGIVPANVNTYTDTAGLIDGTQYVYRVRAVNSISASGYSSPASAITKLNAATNLTATGLATGIQLTWTDNSQSENGYRVARSINGGEFMQVAKLGANITTYIHTTGLTEGATYTYRVQALGDLVNALNSNQVTVYYLRAPSNLQATVDTATRLKITWTDNSAAETGFKIERSTDGTTFSQIATATSTARTYADASVTAGIQYWYRVRAYTALGNSGYSEAATSVLSTPSAPSSLSVSPVSATSARLDWTETSINEAGFKIERSTDGTSFTQIATVGVNVTTYTATGLTAGATYFFRVRAHNPVGNSGYSNVATLGSALPTVSISATDATAAEPGTNTGTFTITRTGNTSDALTVTYIVGGTAANGTDYAALSGTAIIPAGSAFTTVTVTPQDDADVEGSENVTITLSPSGTYTIAGTSEASVAIADNDAPPAGPLVATGSVWKYLDDGSNQGTAWRGSTFNDSAWQSGQAQFGFGDNDEHTLLTKGKVTYYFRLTFTVADASSYNSLMLRLLRDDGAVVYLNGTEITRSNMPTGTITHQTLASSTVGGAAEDTFFESSVNPALLVDGVNVLAVEVHQDRAASSDMSFDLELIGS
jgi:hypothetical protein